MAGWRSVGFSQLSLGLLSILSGILAFFPGGSYRPWLISWDCKIAAPVWTGISATTAGVSVVMANRDQDRKSLWEMAYIFSILCAVTSPLMFAVAMAAVLTGPLCYYSHLGAVAQGYVSHAAGYPYPYGAGRGPTCLDPPRAEWYHLALRTVDLFAATVVFIVSLSTVAILTARLLRTGHVNMRPY